MSPEMFANRFKEAREKKNITIKALQPLVGASPSAMNGYATGKNLPPLDVACKIAKELDVSLDWLCGLNNTSNSDFQINTCEDVAIALDKMVDKFETASINTHISALTTQDDKPNFFISLNIESEALYDYYVQLESTHSYLRNLPVNLREGFIPFKTAMEKELQKKLRTRPETETGFRIELPF